jgi:signal peptidase I
MVRRGVQQLLGGFVLGLIAIALLYFASLFALHMMGYEYAVVVSNSMQPIAQRGDLVVVSPGDDVSVGRVVLFRRGKALVLHRLIKQNPDGMWKTRGDANTVDDPWAISRNDVVGTAFGVLRGFGVPMLLLADDSPTSAHATFTKTHRNSSRVSAGYWATINPTWTIYTNAFAISTGTPIQIALSGDRRLWSGTRFTGMTRVHYEGYMSRVDPGSPGFSVIFNACVAPTDAISCGWQVFFNAISKTATLQAYKADGSLTPALGTCTASISFGSQNTIALRSESGTLSVIANGIECLKLTQISSLLSGTGAQTPSGGFAGVRCQVTSRLVMQKLHFW